MTTTTTNGVSNSMLLEEKEVKEYTGFAKIVNYFTKKSLTEWEVLLFGFCLVMGNRCSNFNQTLGYGYTTTILNLVWAGAGNFALCLVLGEMSSALPFSGGIYGFVRAILGPFHGFIVASMEITFCLSILANRVDTFAPYFPALNVSHSDQGPLTELAIYGSMFILCFIGGKPFFSLTALFGIFSFVMLLAYLIGALKNMGSETVNFTYYAMPDPPMTLDNFMLSRSYTNNQFTALQYLPLLSEYLPNPRTQIPRVIMILITCCIIMTVLICTAAVAQYPGSAKLGKLTIGALKYGWADTFNTTLDVATWFHIPLLYGTNFALLYCSGRQIQAISKSHLLPAFFGTTTPVLNTPWLALSLLVAISFGLGVMLFEYPIYKADIRTIAHLSQYFVFLYCFVAYLVFRRKFSTVERAFKNPFGDATAIFGIINYLSATAASAYWTDLTHYPAWTLLSIFGFSVIFYWTYIVHCQKFSEEEKKVLFKAYLINANRLKRNKIADCKVVIEQKNRERLQLKEIMQRSLFRSSRKNNSIAPIEQGAEVERTAMNSSQPVTEEIAPPLSSRMSVGSVGQYLIKATTSLASFMAHSYDMVDEEDQLAILCTGGIVGPGMHRALQEKFQIEGDEEEGNHESSSSAVADTDEAKLPPADANAENGREVALAQEARAAESV